MKNHICVLSHSCRCSSNALNPNENCSIHGYPNIFQCSICGKFMKYPKINTYDLIEEIVKITEE